MMHRPDFTIMRSILCRRYFRRPKCTRFLSQYSATKIGSDRGEDDDKNFVTSAMRGGQVQGVWVFHRHGDRTPARSLVPDHQFDAEKNFWRKKIPQGLTIYDTLCEKYPTRIHHSNNDGKFFDAHGGKEPYGFLTYRGMDQMRMIGRRMALRYDDIGYHAEDQRNVSQSSKGRSRSDAFLNYWDIKAYSTNYLRTVKSVQCFLDGFLGDTPPAQNRVSYESLEQLTNSHMRRSNHELFIEVRERNRDILNAFDRQPQLMKQLVQDVVTTDSFVTQDKKLTSLAQQLITYLPGLSKVSNYGGPSGINWIHATDHFVCRASHGLEFSRFSTFDGDEQAEDILASMRTATISHLAWRFRQWYQNPSLLAAIVLPPLREIESHMKATTSLGVHERRPFVIYSCHDVTLLSLLYGIGADFIASEEELKEVGMPPTRSGDGEERWKFWPAYASTLVFELVQVRNGTQYSPDNYYVRVLLNGQTIRLISQLKKSSISKDQKVQISLSDFAAIIDTLETRSQIKAKVEEDDATRDMSTWTG